MSEVGKELTAEDRVQQAPKVIVVAGDQPGEMHKYTPYTPKGESYRLDPICGDIQDALSQDRNNKKADRSAAAGFLNQRYATIAECTRSWLDMTLEPAAMGFTNIVESSIKETLKSISAEQQKDILFSYLLGKFDSKLLTQAAISCLRRSALLRCINVGACLTRTITIHDMFIAYARMTVRNWYVRGVVNEIHCQKDLSFARNKTTPEEEARAFGIVELFAHASLDGTVNYDEVLRSMKNKQESVRKFGNHKGLLVLANEMRKFNLLESVQNRVVEGAEERTWQPAANAGELQLVKKITRWVVPTIRVGRMCA